MPYIKVLPSEAYDNIQKRTKLATLVATVVNIGLTGGVPYAVYNDEDFKWVVDTGNDWRLIFDKDDFCQFTIWHRYGNTEVVLGLLKFIAYRIHAKVVEPMPVEEIQTVLNLTK